eukprot:6013780-Prorocentrum_lima.AAC.1
MAADQAAHYAQAWLVALAGGGAPRHVVASTAAALLRTIMGFDGGNEAAVAKELDVEVEHRLEAVRPALTRQLQDAFGDCGHAQGDRLPSCRV